MLHGQDVRIELAAGLDDGSLGTDAVAIADALTAADRGDGVVVLMDLGSAVLSAELALELLDDDVRARVLLCPAPLVEGLVAAGVAAGGGASREAVAAEALASLSGKQSHLAGDVLEPALERAVPEAGWLTATLLVTGPHGLHARPAARLVQHAQAADAVVEVRNATRDQAWVPATSLSRVATIGALSGHELEVRAVGPRAREVLDALVALAARGFDEQAGGTSSSPAPDRQGPPAPPVAGRPAPCSPGVAIGPARPRVPAAAVADTPYERAVDATGEWSRLTAARAACGADLRASRARAATTVGEQGAALFDALLLLLDDDALLTDARRRIDAGQAAPTAWTAAVHQVQSAFQSLPDAYLRERADDVGAVGQQVLRSLLGVGTDGPADDGGPAASAEVLIAMDLTPAEAVALDPTRIVGVVLAAGSATSHSAILVRGLGIPAVVGAGPGVLTTTEGTLVALDGATGELVVSPDDAVLVRFRSRAKELAATGQAARQRSAQPARTSDGVEVHVGANLGSVEDARLAAELGADLAGLVRTEFLFLDRQEAPDVEEQEAIYRGIANAMGGRRITLRTLDVGGDKPLPYLPAPPECNPFLGVRGIRLALAVPGLLADQLLAIVRVAMDTPVSVMFPMVSTVDELLAARRALDGALHRAGTARPAGLLVGMMVEVPAAALKAAAFSPHVDFLSIGTNDLTQYALAAERGNAGVAALADPYDPGVLRLIAATCEGAGDALVAVCGELAADEAAAELLIGLGVRELSVGPRAVAGVKQAVRRVDVRAAMELGARALDAEGPQAVRALLTSREPPS